MASLPPYEILVRWTVVDTTRWLAENGLNEFKDPFKKDGVDGSKLARLTDTDIDAFKVSSTKKRIVLKNAVANIDRSRINSLPRTQGIMNAFRNMEPPTPPRPPRPGLPPPRGEPTPPTNHALPLSSNHHHNQFDDDDDNEDAYSWGDDFNYQSDPEEEYENQEEWTQDNNSNNIGNDVQENYEEMTREPEDEDYYEEPTHSPSESDVGGGILQKLQRELTLRRKTKTNHHSPVHKNAQNGGDSDSDFSDYEQPIETPKEAAAPSLPPRPGGRPEPRGRNASSKEEVPPPRPPKRTPAPAPVDDEVYDEPDQEPVRKSKEEPKTARRPPPVLAIPSPAKEERRLPPTPKNTNKGGNRKAVPLPTQPPPEEQEVYEQMDSQPVQMEQKPKKREVAKVPPPPVDELENYDWYHKNIEREKAENSLKDHGEDGMYLIRKSRRGGTEQQYTLTIYKQNRVYNLPIRKRNKDGKFALGAEKPKELEFDSVPDLVEYFQTKLLMLNPKARSAAGSTKLVYAMPK